MKCSHCNRKLESAHHILGLTLGIECVHKYAFFAGWMNSQGFEFPQEFPMVLMSSGFALPINPDLKDFVARAAKYGIKLEIAFDYEAQIATVTGVKSVDLKQIESYTETREQFAQSVGAL